MKHLLVMLLTLIAGSASAAVIPSSLYGLNDSGDSLFTYTDNSAVLDDSGFTLNFKFGQHNTNDHSFGIYQYDDTANTKGANLQIFNSTDGAGTDSNVVWDFGLGTMETRFGSQSLFSDLFGLYFHSDGQTFYSQSVFNPGGVDHFGFYWNDDPFSDTNLFTYAVDNDTGYNLDYMKVAINDVSPVGAQINQVPEPGTVLLMGLGLLALGARRFKWGALRGGHSLAAA